MHVEIEEIKNKDIEQAYQFCIGIWDELGWDKSFSYELENLKEFFSGPREVFLLAKQEEIIGCAGLKNLSEQEGLLKRFYVVKDFRGKGLALLLLKNIKEFAKKQDYKVIVLDVFKDNFRAKRFFEKHGFKSFNPQPSKNWIESERPDIFEFRKLKLNNK
ncbi:hypothetical protein AMJ47_03095 [Parcubacteria bacterium DG_72]|nr:MAG: hypothetical protein AMJ47_03095 [Parcubacteria bacterium DG_72]